MLDWRRRVSELYAAVRGEADPRKGWSLWREGRDALFRTHPQSPLPHPDGFEGLAYYTYDPGLRISAELRGAEPARFEIAGSAGSAFAFQRVGTVGFELEGAPAELEVYWLEGYGGGVFIPFSDATAGVTTYGAGRYLLDTVKGADLGEAAGRLVLDFNFAYNPSCSYHDSWACPLAPPANRLDAEVCGGERRG